MSATTDVNEKPVSDWNLKYKSRTLSPKEYFYTRANYRMKDDGYKIRDEFGVYYLTFAVVEWIDVFSRKMYVDIALENFLDSAL